MLAPTSQILIVALLAILLPSILSMPYSIYDIKNRRASRASGSSGGSSRSSSSLNGYAGRSSSSIDNQAIYSEPQQQQLDFEQTAYRAPEAVAPAAPYFTNYDTLYDSGADSYYMDDESVDDRPEREYLYGKPTYHGEYKPTRYYYARAPSYSYYGDHVESTNPLDYLHEEMLQEDHNRQRNRPSESAAAVSAEATAPQWLQNTDQSRSLTSNFMKNLMLYNKNGMDMDAQSMDMNRAAELPGYDDDEEIENPYSDDLSNQNEPYDYFDPLKFQHTNQFNHFGSPSTNKQIYYNQDNRKNHDDEQRLLFKNKNQRKPETHNDNSNEDKDEKDLESLRKDHSKSSSNRKSTSGVGGRGRARTRDSHADGKVEKNTHHSDKSKHDNDNYNGGYDTGFDYEEDEWINWNRKRSLPKESPRPLKALEQKLTEALKFQADALKLIATTTTAPLPPTNTASSSNSDVVSSLNGETRKHKGQKEVVLSRPATPLRRHYPANVLDALSKTVDETNQSHQMNAEMHSTGKNDHSNTHAAASKKQKRYVSNEASLAQQLNGLKRKIKT